MIARKALIAMIKNKFRYLMLIMVVGLLTILYDNYVMGVIFCTVVILPFLLFFVLFYSFKKIRVDLKSSVHVVNKGELIPISVILNNPTIFPLSNLTICLYYGNSYSQKKYRKEISVSIDQKSKTTVICNMISEHTGNLEISLKCVRLHDYFHIFSLNKKLQGDLQIAIMPRMYEISETIVTDSRKLLVESDFYSSVKPGDDASEVFAIREYREGDRLQRIHWKLSMKQDQLMIKDFSEPINCSVIIMVDLYIPNKNVLNYMDGLLESALSLSYSLLLKGQIHYFSYYDQEHGECKRYRIIQEKDLYEVVDGLLHTSKSTEKEELLRGYIAQHPNEQYTDLFYVACQVTQEQLDHLALIKTLESQYIYVNQDIGYKPERELEKLGENIDVKNQWERLLREMGIGFVPIHTGRMKEDIEQWKLC